MRYEWKKVVSQRRLCLLLVIVVLYNAVAFYQNCTDAPLGFTMQQVQEKYVCADTLEQEMSKLEERVWDAASISDSDAYITGNSYTELLLDRAVLERLDQCQEYETYLSSLISDAQIKLKLGLMGSKDSFSTKTVQRSMEAYQKLGGTVPEASFSGGTELFTSFPLTDGLCLAFALLPALWLLTVERDNGLLYLTRTTRRGRSWLFRQKFGTMMAVISAGFLLLYGSNAAIALGLFGLENMAKPLQSVFGFQGCAYSITVGGFLVVFLLLKYLWVLCCGAILFALCSGSRNIAVPAFGGICLAALAAALGSQPFLWLQTASLTHLAQGQSFFQGLIYLNLLGTPVPQLVVAVVLLTVGLTLAYAAGLLCFCRTPRGSTTQKKSLHRAHRTQRHSLTWYEGYKLLITSGGMVLLTLLLVASVTLTSERHIWQSKEEQQYRAYSVELNGAPSAEKDTFLETETQYFIDLSEKITAAYEQYGDDARLNPAVQELLNALEAQKPFEKAKAQYASLRQGQVYLYQTPYELLLGAPGKRTGLVQAALFCLTVALAASRYFTMETDTGVARLQQTAGKSRQVWCRKILWTGAFLLPAAAAAGLPRLASVWRLYGPLLLTVQANSAEPLSSLKDAWSLSGYMLVCTVSLLLAGCLTIAVSALTAKRTENSVMAFLFPLLVVLPVVCVVGVMV